MSNGNQVQPASAQVEPPCLVLLGKLGDIINALPIAAHFAARFNAPVPFVAARRYVNVLEGCSYVLPEPFDGDFFTGLPDALAAARTRHQNVIVLQTNGSRLDFKRQARSFCEEAFAATGLDREQLPLVFDRRAPEREAALLERAMAGSDKPLVLFNLQGLASPFPCAAEFEAWLRREWAGSVRLWDLNEARPSHIFDLLTLYEHAVCLITIDTATLHLAAATPRLPVIFFSPDKYSAWHSTIPRDNCALQIQYGAVLQHLTAIDRTLTRLAGAKGRDSRLFHSGDLGDIVYSLLFAKTLKPVQFFLGPTDRFKTREPFTRARFDFLAPLLKRQSWIKRVEYSDAPPASLRYDLNEFRLTWFSKANATRLDKQLWAAYQEHFGGPQLDPSAPWLEADPALDTAHPVIISRTLRWQNNNFPWVEVVRRYSGRLAFVGLPEEFADWSRRFGRAAEFRPVIDALDLANIIAGAELFVGNQSFAGALALALGVPTIQETCLYEPDCVVQRPNVQCCLDPSKIVWPELKPHPWVGSTPSNPIKLGPCNGAPGLGDTLMLTPTARALGRRAVMLLPPSMARFAFLFHNLCPVQISNDFPVFPWAGQIMQSLGHLRHLGLTADPVPKIELREETVEQARQTLAAFPNPLAFCPTCSRHWAHQRQRPPEFWASIVRNLAQRHTVLQFGLGTYPTVAGAQRLPFKPLEELAAIYHLCARYVGVNTGDYHLMVAVGGKTVVANPVPWNEAAAWNYALPGRVRYANLNDSQSVLNACRQLFNL